LQSGTQARADWRALMGAAVIGTGVGLSLGGAYLAAGANQVDIAREGADQIAQAVTSGGLTASALRPSLEAAVPVAATQDASRPAAQLAALDPDAARVAKAKPSRARELDCLTQAVYFEARGESPRGQAAVATVIMNRVKSPAFPKTVCGVVYQGAGRRNGCQFSFACDGLVERVVENGAWSRARKVAARVLSGAVLRDVGSATHFHTTGVSPQWGSRMLRTAQVGLHVFYRFNPNASRRTTAQPATQDAVFTSAPAAAQPELRLATALTSPPAGAEAPQTAAAHPAAHPTLPATHLEARPAPKIELPAAPVAKADTAATKAAAES
jgi:spore germination cell wall hydrolase CwlJ-like protein